VKDAAAALALLVTPLLVLGSVHELYLRNQHELEGTRGVLAPFWGVALLVMGLGALAWALRARAAARAGLWAYHLAGGFFLLYSLARQLPWGERLAGWALDQTAGAAALVLAYVASLALVVRAGWAPPARPLALFALVLLGQEAHRLGTRLEPAAPAAEAAPPELPAAEPGLANVYHVVLDAFQPDLFDMAWAGAAGLEGFVYYTRARSLHHATDPSMATVLAGRASASGEGLAAALADRDSLALRLRAAGYRNVAYLPANVYPAALPAFDQVVWHESLPARRRAGFHRWVFARLWAFQTLPLAVTERLAAANVLGLSADDLRSLRSQRMSVLTQPVTTLLGYERYLEQEAALPAAGRYTFIHLLVPHGPYLLDADCSHGDASRRTDPLAQSRCAASLLRRLLARLQDLGRLEASTVLVHSDHGCGVRLTGGRFVEDAERWRAALLLVRPAGASGPLRRSEEPASLLDVAPTLLGSLGLEPGPRYEGRVLPRAGAAPPAPAAATRAGGR
jgi:hypothetical protein